MAVPRKLGNGRASRRRAGVRAAAYVLLACAATLVAGCSSTAPGPSAVRPATSASPTIAPVPSAQPETPGPSASSPGCRISGIAIRVADEVGHAAGSTYYLIVLTNASGAPCTLSGYPEVSFVSARGGTRIGEPARRGSEPAPSVMLAPGGDAHAILQISNADLFDPSACRPVRAHWLSVALPGESTPVDVQFTPGTEICSLGGQLAIEAFVSGSR